MSTVVRPHFRFSTALVVAGVVTAAPIVAAPVHHAPPVFSTVAVHPASLVTNALNNIGQLVDVGIYAVILPLDAVSDFPAFTAAAVAEALQHPSQAPSILSYLVQVYGNPAASSFIREFLTAVPGGLAHLLPYPLGPNSSGTNPGLVATALKNTEITIGKFFAGLPNPATGATLVDGALTATPAGQLVFSIAQVIPSVANAIAEPVSWLAHLPGVLEASVESAIRVPGQIPGLISYLVHRASGLLTSVISDLAAPLITLPAPVGNVVAKAVSTVISGVSGVVDKLFPAPVTPKPFPAAATTGKATAAKSLAATTSGPTHASAKATAVPAPSAGKGGVPASPKAHAKAPGASGVTAVPLSSTGGTGKHHK